MTKEGKVLQGQDKIQECLTLSGKRVCGKMVTEGEKGNTHRNRVGKG